MNRNEKAAVVEDLNSKLDNATIAIVTDYKGLTVASFQELRRELKKNNAEIRVAKNTLLRRAVDGTPFEVVLDHLKGTTALTVSYADPVAPAKILTEFAKSHPELEIRCGALEGKALSPDDLVALSKLPSKEVMLATLLSVMNAVPTSLVQVLSAIPRSMVYTIQAIKDKKEQETN
ncbi:MAG: 50S ribosomal protein L10 [Desulfobulbaceae bacterium]|uniref:Large ribosomal subunit protein uL10 n=1 Tax=Candidatus Desulfobia pelagia TaxID=2841692 RepID=A0A8J6NHJ6_9BACT|nr:50S ribosomal protein L10 [Candidatus Desulfobia pelagia]